MPEQIYEEFGRRLRAIRKSEGLTLEELGERAGLTASYLGQVERLERKVSLRTVERVALSLKVCSGSFFCSEGKHSTTPGSEPPWCQQVCVELKNLPMKRRKIILDAITLIVHRRHARRRRQTRA